MGRRSDLSRRGRLLARRRSCGTAFVVLDILMRVVSALPEGLYGRKYAQGILFAMMLSAMLPRRKAGEFWA